MESPALYEQLTKMLTQDEQNIVQSAINQAGANEQQLQQHNAAGANGGAQ